MGKWKCLWDCSTVLIFSLLSPLYDTCKDWYVVITLFVTKNYAWGSLFALPLMYGYLGQCMIWHHEEKTRKDSPRKGIRWCWIFAPFYGLFRSWSLLKKVYNVLRGKSNESYQKEKDRISSRINPVELFNETLPQLLIMNAAVVGLVVNSNIDLERRQEALEKGRNQRGIMSYWTSIPDMLADSVLQSYNSSFSTKMLRLENLEGIYSSTEIDPLLGHIDVFSYMYHLSFLFAMISTAMFMFEGPIPMMSILPEVKEAFKTENRRHYVSKCLDIFISMFKIFYFIFGPIRQIAVFNLILCTYYVDNSGKILEGRELFWIKLLIFAILIALPPVAIQHYFLRCYNKQVYAATDWNTILRQIPFIYGIPLFTGEFASLKKIKRISRAAESGRSVVEEEEKTDIKDIVLRQSQKARFLYVLIRIVITTFILVLIWKLQSLKVLGVEYFAYLHVVNGFEILSATLAILLKLVGYMCSREGFQYHLHEKKFGFFHPDLVHDRTYYYKRTCKLKSVIRFLILCNIKQLD